MKPYVMWDIDFRDKINIDELNKKIDEFIKLNPSVDLVLQVPSTQGATSSFVQKLDPRIKIRIAGAYDAERLEAYKKVKFTTGADCKEAFIDSVIYTRNETVRILSEIEKIESGIMPNWTDLQKALYIYDVLKTTIVYDAKYKQRSWAEVRSLRGLITKQTVCAGYSLIYKEILERNGIQCKFVVGSAHAWNILIIDDQYISADITHDHYNYRRGKLNTHNAFGQRDSEFNRPRKTEPQETFTKYKGNLTQLDPKFVLQLAEDLSIQRTHEKESFRFVRSDGSRFFLSQIGKKVTKSNGFNIVYYRYYYSEANPDGTLQEPKIIYSYFDLVAHLEAVRFGEVANNSKKHAVLDVLFSKENIRNSEMLGTPFIGHESLGDRSVRTVSEIKKSPQDIQRIGKSTRTFTGKNGQKIVIEEIKEPEIVMVQNKEKKVYTYKYYEFDHLSGVLKSNTIHTEMNLLLTNNPNVAYTLLQSSRITKRTKTSGGYIGYLDDRGTIKINTTLANYYSVNKRVEDPAKNPTRPMLLPELSELDYLARRYEILFDQGNNKIVVRDIKTKQILADERKELKAIFANVWLVSAGLKTNSIEERKGVKEAFSQDKANLYAYISRYIISKLQMTGTFDTVELYKNVKSIPMYEKIVLNMCKNEMQLQMVMNMFAKISRTNNPISKPQVLHSKEHAEELLAQRRK